ISRARASGTRSSASTMSSHGVVIWSIAQFFCAAEPKYCRWTSFTFGNERAIATVSSVEKESTRRISSAKSRLSRHSRRLASSLKVVTMTVRAGRGMARRDGRSTSSVHPHLHPLDLPGLPRRFVDVDDGAGEADVLLRGLEGPRRLRQEFLDD